MSLPVFGHNGHPACINVGLGDNKVMVRVTLNPIRDLQIPLHLDIKAMMTHTTLIPIITINLPLPRIIGSPPLGVCKMMNIEMTIDMILVLDVCSHPIPMVIINPINTTARFFTRTKGHEKGVQSQERYKGREKKKKENLTGQGVFNLSAKSLTKEELSVLDKGLKLAPPRKLDRFGTYIDVHKYIRK